MTQAKITVIFYFGTGDETLFHLNKKYILQNWQSETHLRKLLDEIAKEMNHLSGYGIYAIKVDTDERKFEVSYRNEITPYTEEEEIHQTNYWFRDCLRFRAGRYKRKRGGLGSEVWLEIPRFHFTTGAGNPVQPYVSNDTIFKIKAVAVNSRKERKRTKSRYRIYYDQSNPHLDTFAQKIASGTLTPNSSKEIEPIKNEAYVKSSIRWWYLPDAQTTYHKLEKHEAREAKRKKAEDRKEKELAKAGVVYKDKGNKKKAQQVYIVHMQGDTLTEDLYKIGISNAPGKRLQSLNTSSPFELELIHKFVAEPAEEAETKLHKRFARFRMSGEWFKLTPDQITELTQITEYRNGEFIKSKKGKKKFLKRVLGKIF